MRVRTRICFGIPAIFLLCGGIGTGCGGKAPESPVTVRVAQREVNPAPAGGEGPAKAEKGAVPSPARKVIQSSSVSVVVKELDAARQALNQLIDENAAYVSKSEFHGNRGTRRTATCTIRVPADKFAKFVEAVLNLGVPDHQTSDAQDVTEEFVDIEARVKNLKAEEETLNRLMKEMVKSNTDLLAFREQIRQLREKIETAEARLEKLTGLTSLSTLHLTMSEEKDYVPPSAPSKPTFGGRINETFAGSLELLSQLGELLLLGGVAIAPWLPLIAVAGGCLWLLRGGRKERGEVVASPSSTTEAGA